MKEKKSVNIIGSGISGLSVAFYLIRAGFAVTVYEKEERVGGLLGTKKTPFGLVEQAANAFLANKELEDVSHCIGVKLLEKKTSAKKRYIYRKGRPRRWPLGFIASFRFFFFILFFSVFKKAPKGQSLKDWAYKSMGKEATHFLLAPAMQGIFVGQPGDLSARLILKALFLNRPPRGQLRGSVCAEFGMGDWIKNLRSYLKKEGCQFIMQEEVNSLDRSVPCIVATDLQSAKKIIKDESAELYKIISGLKSVSLSSVTLHFESEKDSYEGFGCLFPREENFNALGVLFNHHIFDHRAEGGILSETWIFNDERSPVSEMTESELLDLILEDRMRLRKVDERPMRQFVHQWNQKIPLYDNNLEKALENDLCVEKNLFLFGNYLGSLGLSKILVAAKKISEQVIEDGQWQK